MKQTKHAVLVLLMAGSLFLSGCGSDKRGSTKSAEGDNIRLAEFEGTAHVTDEAQKVLAAREQMNLYSGYGVSTEAVSYAWIFLDAEKMLKMDENSAVGITKNDKHLHIDLKEGGLFFCAEHLAEDEELRFDTVRPCNMSMAIRGTTGYINTVSDDTITVGLCEGSVELAFDDQTVTLESGRKVIAVIGEDRQVHIEETPLDYQTDVPMYVLEELFDGKAHDKLIDAGLNTQEVDQIAAYRSSDSTQELLEKASGRWDTGGQAQRIAHLDLMIPTPVNTEKDKAPVQCIISFTFQSDENDNSLVFETPPFFYRCMQIDKNTLRFQAVANDRIPDQFVGQHSDFLLSLSDDGNTITVTENGVSYTETRRN